MHIPEWAAINRNDDGSIHVSIKPGEGSSPDVSALFSPASPSTLTDPWSVVFRDWAEMLAYCVPQDCAMSVQPWYQRITISEIELSIPLNSCRALTGKVDSHIVEALVGAGAPICFIAERARFRFRGERDQHYTIET